MWMVEPGGELDLAQESVGTERRREVRMQDFQCNDAIVFCVLGKVDSRHAATTELPIYRIGARQRLAQPLNRKCCFLLQPANLLALSGAGNLPRVHQCRKQFSQCLPGVGRETFMHGPALDHVRSWGCKPVKAL